MRIMRMITINIRWRFQAGPEYGQRPDRNGRSIRTAHPHGRRTADKGYHDSRYISANAIAGSGVREHIRTGTGHIFRAGGKKGGYMAKRASGKSRRRELFLAV